MTFFEEKIQAQIDRERSQHEVQGWGFKERSSDTHTIGDFIRAVLAIDNATDARRFYEGYVMFLEPQPDRTHPADYVAKANIGWCFGEGMALERITMWRDVCAASHPVFGAMVTLPTAEEALEAGERAAQGK